MNCIIPFEKRLSFEGPVCEIESISLEHEVTQSEDKVLGNFILTGNYKEFEAKIETKDFKFIVPFEVALERKIKENTLVFNIDNFTYELDGNEMVIKIDYAIDAEDDDLIPFEREMESFEPLEHNDINEELDVDRHYENVNTLETKDFITYHVHVIKENDTIESICTYYKILKEDIEKVNDSINFEVGSKLIVPLPNE